ncbi:hypothetical protein BJ508DRAFT_22640 [Ascobolus immersus RN42]|uniref:Methylated-DNA--protein-cysteine methyltransferase n=1 Tax=Ascobolus immersus RN42 TaxID=1160509 RepID=A0A3N4HNI4_ASCIM|nr:hypothetical protein BJ508DRAFT_22640 [Ascobolus immersus RN42]
MSTSVRTSSPKLGSDHEEFSPFFPPSPPTTEPERASTDEPDRTDIPVIDHKAPDESPERVSFESIVSSVKPAPKTTDFQNIPKGRVTTYAMLSNALKSSPRAVGGALKRNPFAPRVPCHRVVAANGFLGGFFGEWKKEADGTMGQRKLRLLKDEGVIFDKKGFLVERRRIWGAFKA